MIIEPTFIISDLNKIEKGKTIREIIIKKENSVSEDGLTKLAHVFDEMPFGLIFKEETGIGATTLELYANRNSIIVEPTRVTASSKAKKHNALYVGGKTKNMYGTSDKRIKGYLYSPVYPKKIVVVADSLYRLVSLLKDETNLNFFLMIDEIDSFQLDSSYRKSMENCLDIYKTFPLEKRCMVTATSLEFSDPSITDAMTIIKYDVPTFRKMTLLSALKIEDKTRNSGKVENEKNKAKKHYISIIKSIATNKIQELIINNPNEKLMIAYNSISGCYDIAKHLIKHKILSEEDIKILCSTNSKEKVKEFYTELESDLLPAKLNFCTSAYFTGFDINERYHLISISSVKSTIQTLSDKRLKQIAGRCRDKEGLLSETVIFDAWEEMNEINYNVEDCLALANKEIAALQCITNNYNGHPLLKQNIDKIRELIVESTQFNGFRFLRWKSKNEPAISYLNIDAFIEQIRVRNELYSTKFDLYDCLLNAGHQVNILERRDYLIIEKNDLGIADRIERVKAVMDLVKNPESELKHLNTFIEDKSTNGLQKFLLMNIIEFTDFVKMDKFLSLIEAAAPLRDKRKLNNILLGAYYFTLDRESHYKRTVEHYISVNNKFTSKELLKLWNLIFLESGIHKQLESEVQAVRLSKLHFRLIKKRKDPNLATETEATFTIKNENPFKFRLIKARPFKDDNVATISALLSGNPT